MFGGDVGNEKGGADKEPTDVPRGEKICFSVLLLASEIHPDAEDDGEVDANNDDVGGSQSTVRHRDLRVEHPNLPHGEQLGRSRRLVKQKTATGRRLLPGRA